MKPGHYLFTSESVSEGHPDKIADQISDGILDEIYKNDPNGRVACEVLVTTGVIIISGQITTSTYVNMPKVAREIVKEIGYDHSALGFDCHTCSVFTCIEEQSPDIAMGVDAAPGHEQGAGDQGMMFGFALKETPEYMPLPITLAHSLLIELSKVRKNKELTYLRPDSKSQVAVEYNKKGEPVRIDSVIISTQHDPDVTHDQIEKDVIKRVVRKIIPANMLDSSTKYYINPTGRFVLGGPFADTGLTGRKIIVDTYGGMGRHGGGAFSGKDATKVDRSAAYAARWVAKNIVASGLADKCEIQIAYAIGIARPTSININTFGTGKISEEKLSDIVMDTFDLTPSGIISRLKLRRPIFKKTAAYGHFGRCEEGFTWEELDMVDVLREKAGKQ